MKLLTIVLGLFAVPLGLSAQCPQPGKLWAGTGPFNAAHSSSDLLTPRLAFTATYDNCTMTDFEVGYTLARVTQVTSYGKVRGRINYHQIYGVLARHKCLVTQRGILPSLYVGVRGEFGYGIGVGTGTMSGLAHAATLTVGPVLTARWEVGKYALSGYMGLGLSFVGGEVIQGNAVTAPGPMSLRTYAVPTVGLKIQRYIGATPRRKQGDGLEVLTPR